MDQENEILDYNTRDTNIIRGAQNIYDFRKKKRTKVEAINDYKQLKIKSSQFLLFFTLLVGLLTTIGTLWIIFRLNLTSLKRHLEFGPGNDLHIRQDIITDSFMPFGEVDYKEIVGDTIKISSPVDSKLPTEINLDNETVLMQAKIFSSSQTNDQYSFRISRRLQTLEASKNSNNVKLIRSPGSVHKTSSRRSMNKKLDIISRNQLELSGNMGLRVHANQMYFDSQQSIKIQSKEESIILLIEKGLHLPAILHENHYKELLSYQNTSMDTSYATNNNNRFSEPLKQQVCIARDNGMIYLSADSC